MLVLRVVFVTIFFLTSILYVKCIAHKKGNIPYLLNFTIKPVANPQKIIQSFGYPAETHRIVTEDGYILALHRIPKGLKNVTKKAPVLIMHGMFASSADFVTLGPQISLGYILADEGYDVWLGNARGNSYSNRHIYLNPHLNSKTFYNFSWHEIGTIDLPTKIDYILNVTNQKKLHYIGHSQGSTVFYVMSSTKPEYNNKIRLASLMAPAGFVNNSPEPMVSFLSQYVDNLQSVLDFFHIYHIPLLNFVRSFLENLCKKHKYLDTCKKVFYLIFSRRHSEGSHQMNKKFFQKILQATPSDTSCKQFLHYLQEAKSGKFQRFDFGTENNLKMYGSSTPLEYNLTVMTAPIAHYYALNDRYVGVKDVQLMSSKLPRIINNYLVPCETFNHIDFLYANDVKFLLYNELLRLMELY